MSLLDFAPRTDAQIEAQQDIRLRMRFSPRQAFWVPMGALLLFLLYLFVGLELTDPEFHLRSDHRGFHPRGRGRAIIHLLLAMPLWLRATVLCSLGVALAVGLVALIVRVNDRRIDYVIGRRGVTDVGLFRSRHLEWREIKRVVVFEQQQRSWWGLKTIRTGTTFAEFDTGADSRVRGRIGRASYTLLSRKKITISLRLVGVDRAEMKRIVRRFQPAMPITEEIRYV
jgi:hypothetical protein